MQLNQRPIKKAGKKLHKEKIVSDKKKRSIKNFAYIDGANLYEATKYLKWQLDYQRSILVAKKEKAPDGDKIP